MHGFLHEQEFGNIFPITVAKTTFSKFVPNGNGSHLLSSVSAKPTEKYRRKM